MLHYLMVTDISKTRGDRRSEIRALTGLRGVAAVFVATYHFGHFITDPHVHWAVHKGYLSVDIFFVLSGFVMATTYRDLFSNKVRLSNFGRFLWLRVARIWPLYLVAVLAALSLHEASIYQAATNIFMVQAWGFAPSINPPLWSVSVEFVAYLLFPWLLAFILRSDRTRLLLVLFACLSAISFAMWIGAHNGIHRAGRLDLYDVYSPLPALRCVAGFTLGIVVWKALQIRNVARVAGTSWFGLTCVIPMLLLFVINANDLLIYLFFPLLVLSIAQDKGILARVLGSRHLHTLGLLSFAIYALQAPYYDLGEPYIAAITAASSPIASTVEFYLFTAVGLLLLSLAAHHFIERPVRLAMRSLTNMRRGPAVS